MDRQRWPSLYSHVKREFLAGGFAGSVGIFIGFPFDIIKVRLQVYPDKYPNAYNCLKQALKSDGILGLYKGSVPPILIQGLINSLMFFGEASATRVLEPNLRPGEVGKAHNAFLAGVAGGLLQCVALVPSEVIKCKLQVQLTPSSIKINEFTRTLHCIREIYQQEGFAGFYRGFSATALREAPSIGLYFFTYKYCKNLLNQLQGIKQANEVSIMLAGGFAGALSWTVVYPFDVLKTNIQINQDPKYASLLNMSKYLYSKHGLKVFFRGLGTTIIRAFPVNASTFYVYEKLKIWFHFYENGGSDHNQCIDGSLDDENLASVRG